MKKIFTLIAAAFLSLGAQAELVKKADTSTGFNTIQNLSSKENVANIPSAVSASAPPRRASTSSVVKRLSSSKVS